MGLIVGIDLGTTFSVISYLDEKKTPIIIKNKFGMNTTPSCIGFKSKDEYVIGEEAKEMEAEGNINTVSFYKLQMGNPEFKVSYFGNDYTACDLSAMFLKNFISDAEKVVGQKITDAVITVPAYFENYEREKTIEAGRRAGLHILNIINEPTAATIAYGLKSDGEIKNVLIYDLGGGTFDVTIAKVTEKSIDVIASSGHHALGGKNWDIAICNWVNDEFYKEFGIDLSQDEEQMAINMALAEKAKRTLSTSSFFDINIKYDGKKGKYRLTNEIFKLITFDLLDITKQTIDDIFDSINISWNDIDGVILVGGSTKMKMVKEYVVEMTGKQPLAGVHPDEAVSIGATIQANIERCCRITLSGSTAKPKINYTLLPGAKKILESTSHSLGMVCASEDNNRFINDIMISRFAKLDTVVKKRRELTVSKQKDKNELEIYLLQGESEEPWECTIAKKFVFNNIDFIEGRKTKLDISYGYDQNNIIDIQAIQVETGKTLSRREEPIPKDMSWLRKSPKELYEVTTQQQTGAIYMALDVSGSMYGEPMRLAQKAMINFVNQFDTDYIKIGIVAFANRPKLVLPASQNKNKIIETINQLSKLDLGGGTSSQPVKTIYNNLLKHQKDGDTFLYGIVLTDGDWYGGADTSALIDCKDFKPNGLELVAIGFGDAQERFLKKISTRSDLANVTSIENINENLSKIARVISE